MNNKKQRWFYLNLSRGSALLYTIVLLGALMLVAELAYSYIVFSLSSRRDSYTS